MLFSLIRTIWFVCSGVLLITFYLYGQDSRPKINQTKTSMSDLIATIQSTKKAIVDLKTTFTDRYPNANTYLARLDAIQLKLETIQRQSKVDCLMNKYRQSVLEQQRLALLANPLLWEYPLLYVTRHQYQKDHHNTATLFQTGEINTEKFQGPGTLKILNLKTKTSKTLLTAPEGVIRDPEVHFEGRKIIFSMRKHIQDDYHIYEINTDGSNLQQLTFGQGISDIDPLYLPDGTICFTSTREPKYCMCNRHIMGNLFRMEADGANIHQIGKSTLFEGHAALLPDGRILYDRWEYVDRNFGDAQGLWTCRPDGSNHAIYWGNNTNSPGGVIDARPIPGTQRVLSIFGSCHDRPWGALAVVDRRLGLDGKEPVIRTWPDSAIHLVNVGNWDTFKKVKYKYEDPFPLSEKYFLCSKMVNESEKTGLYLLDVFGNEVLVHIEEPGCYDPMPVKSTTRPTIIPNLVQLEKEMGSFYVYNVYEGTGMERVNPGTVRFLRVVESPEKRFYTNTGWPGQGRESPAMNWDDFNNKRILGTVPVRADGSAYFRVPADRFIYFQLLDKNKQMIQSMRSGTMVRPGEIQGCVGCHDNRLAVVPNHVKEAFSHPPDTLEPWFGPVRKFSYCKEVQPVFDKHCVKCHDIGKPAGEKLILADDLGLAFNASYNELYRKKYINAIGAGPAEIQMPYSWGSHASKLVQVLEDGHHDVRLSDEDLQRITTWIDINAPYYPVYASAYPENLFGRSPLTNDQLDSLSNLTGIDWPDYDFDGDRTKCAIADVMVNLSRPEQSLCLAVFQNKKDPRYKSALSIIRQGKNKLQARPRADMSGFELQGIERKRELKYQTLVEIQKQMQQAIIKNEKEYSKTLMD